MKEIAKEIVKNVLLAALHLAGVFALGFYFLT